jgi:hypothetical protein
MLETKVIDGNGAIVKLEIYRSGKAIDGRDISRADVTQIFSNTKKYILSQNVTILLKFGHDDRDQTIKGEVLDIELKRKRKKKTLGYELSLIARVHFRGRAFELFKAGELPNVSAEIAPAGYTEDGEEHGQYLMGLALLGIDVPAIPWLQTKFQYDDAVYYYSYLPGRNLHFEKTKKDNSMENEQFQIPDEIRSAVEVLYAWITAEPSEEEPPVEDNSEKNETTTDTTDFEQAQQKIKELESKLADKENTEKIDSAFAKLHSAGKVKPDDKQIFQTLASNSGLDKAMELYSSKPTIKTPPLNVKKSENLKDEQGEAWMQYKSVWEEHYKKTLPKNIIKDPAKFSLWVENAAKLQHEKVNGGAQDGSNR